MHWYFRLDEIYAYMYLFKFIPNNKYLVYLLLILDESMPTYSYAYSLQIMIMHGLVSYLCLAFTFIRLNKLFDKACFLFLEYMYGHGHMGL